LIVTALFITILAAAALGFVVYALPQLIRWFQVRRWGERSGVMVLTYDDGPDRQTTPQLLELLEQAGVKATFYLVGFRAERCPAEMERLRASGHELGAHSHDHLHAWKVAPWREFMDAHKGYRTMAHTVPATGPFRPPFGKITFPTMVSMWCSGRRVEWWSVETGDTDDTLDDVGSVADRVLNAGHPVVLMHCHHEEPEKRRFVLELTKTLIERGRRRGVKFVRMCDFLPGTAGALQ
jgi:peptidoglycan/xylan/chitin deacetylase (PgdA/CDA1 family)